MSYWWGAALDRLAELIASGEPFGADDVTEAVGSHGAIGALFACASREGWIHTDLATRTFQPVDAASVRRRLWRAPSTLPIARIAALASWCHLTHGTGASSGAASAAGPSGCRKRSSAGASLPGNRASSLRRSWAQGSRSA